MCDGLAGPPGPEIPGIQPSVPPGWRASAERPARPTEKSTPVTAPHPDGSLGGLRQVPIEDPHNWSVRRIAAIARAFPELVSYLEVGVDKGSTFENVPLRLRVGVDPAPKFDLTTLPPLANFFRCPSDEYFARLDPAEQFDVVFLDGLHTFQQTYRDLINALEHCPRGIVLVDDVVPSDEVSAIPDLQESFSERQRRGLPGLPWHGDVFRMMLVVADHHPELDWVTITDPDNPQTFIWKRELDRPSRHIGDDMVETYRRFSYDDIFGNGVPTSFRPASEIDGVAMAIAGLALLRQQRRSLPRRTLGRIRREVRRLSRTSSTRR